MDTVRRVEARKNKNKTKRRCSNTEGGQSGFQPSVELLLCKWWNETNTFMNPTSCVKLHNYKNETVQPEKNTSTFTADSSALPHVLVALVQYSCDALLESFLDKCNT